MQPTNMRCLVLGKSTSGSCISASRRRFALSPYCQNLTVCYESTYRKQDFHPTPDMTKAEIAHLPSKSSAILVGFDEAMEDSTGSGEVGLET